MISCPNCNADMRFSPEKQKMVCDFCGTEEDPSKFAGDGKPGAEESEYFETTVFTCPQCGGEIMSTSDTAVTFCSYCGTSVALEGRISQNLKPRYVIPFKIGKSEAEDIYKKRIKKAIYAPSYLKEDKNVDKFRGIYMPYWTYTINEDERVTVDCKDSHRKGDYIITDHYDVSVQCNGTYKGISYDASKAFDDTFSQAIDPYNSSDETDFNIAYLSGFYADAKDVSEDEYEHPALDVVREDVADKLAHDDAYKKYDLLPCEIRPNVSPVLEKSEYTMHPVWFLGNRAKDRVNYAVVNGQTGKIAVDIPVAPAKFILGSLIMAVLIFALLNTFFVFTPTGTMILTLIIGAVCAVGEALLISSISRRGEKMSYKKLIKIGAAMAVGLIVLIIHPVSDLWYYSACLIVMIVIGLSFIDIIRAHNILTTRPMPQLGSRGGDEHAEI